MAIQTFKDDAGNEWELVPETAPAPVTPQSPAPKAVSSAIDLGDYELVPETPAPVAAAPKPATRDWTQRFKDSFGDSLNEGFVGIASRKVNDWLDTGMEELRARNPNLTEDQLEKLHDEFITKTARDLREQAAEREKADPNWRPDESFLDATLAGRWIPWFAGQVAGAAGDPTSYITAGAGPIGRIATQAGVSGLSDAAYQGVDLMQGVRDAYDPMQSLVQGAVGAGFQSAGELVGAGAKKVGEALGIVKPEAAEAPKADNPFTSPERPEAPRFTADQEAQYVDLLKTGSVDDIVNYVQGLGFKISRAETERWVNRRAGNEDRARLLYTGEGRRTSEEAAASLPSATPGRLSKQKVQEVVDNVSKDWANKPNIVVVDSVGRIPDPQVRADFMSMPEADRRGILGSTEEDGTIYIFANQFVDEDTVKAVTYHEALGHYGLTKKFEGELDDMLETLYTKGSKNFQDAVDQWMTDNPNAYPDKPLARAVDEKLAEISERGEIPVGLLDPIKNRIKDFLRDKGVDLKYSDREILSILGLAHREVTGGKIGSFTGPSGKRFMRLWHGTPHRFENTDEENPLGKFDHRRMGSGEGAQAYGWGTYLTDTKSIAEGYRDKLSRKKSVPEIFIGGGTLNNWFDSKTITIPSRFIEDKVFPQELFRNSDKRRIEEILSDSSTSKEEKFKELEDMQAAIRLRSTSMSKIGTFEYNNMARRLEEQVKQIEELKTFVEKSDFKTPEPSKSLYEVEIPDDAKWLDWDKPVTDNKLLKALGMREAPEESLDVLKERYENLTELADEMEALRDAGDPKFNYDDLNEIEQILQKTSEAIWEYREPPKGEEVYNTLTAKIFSEEDVSFDEAKALASIQLSKLGYTGNRYLDGFSRGRGEGSYNYVVFDDKTPKITNRFARQKGTKPEDYLPFGKQEDFEKISGQEKKAFDKQKKIGEKLKALENSPLYKESGYKSPSELNEKEKAFWNNYKKLRDEYNRLEGQLDSFYSKKKELEEPSELAQLTAKIEDNEATLEESGYNEAYKYLVDNRFYDPLYDDMDARFRDFFESDEDFQAFLNLHDLSNETRKLIRDKNEILDKEERRLAELDRNVFVKESPKQLNEKIDLSDKIALVDDVLRKPGEIIPTRALFDKEFYNVVEFIESFDLPDWPLSETRLTNVLEDDPVGTLRKLKKLYQKAEELGYDRDFQKYREEARWNGKETILNHPKPPVEKYLPKWRFARKPQASKPKSRRTDQINLDLVSDNTNINDFLKQAAENYKPGKQSFDDVQDAADFIEMTPKQAARAKVSFTPEQTLAFKRVMVESAKRIETLADKMAKGGSERDQAEFMQAIATHATVQEKYMGIATQAGRLLNSLKIIAQDFDNVDPIALGNMLKEQGNAIFGDRAQVIRLAQIIQQHAAAGNLKAVSKLAQATFKPKAEDYIFSAWYNIGLLSAPATHTANMVGTGFNFVSDIVDHGLAAVMGQTRRWSPTADRVMGREVAARLWGTLVALKQFNTYKSMANSFMTGTVGGQSTNKFNAPNLVMPGRSSFVLEAPTRMLAAEDEFFRQVIQTSNIYGLAVREAGKKNLKGKAFWAEVDKLIKNPTQSMIDKTTDYTKVIQFMDQPSFIGKILNDAAHRVPAKASATERIFRGALRFAIPFVRTPDAIIRAVIRRSGPLGALDRYNIQGMKGTKAEQDLVKARILLGSTMAAFVAIQAANGNITGEGPQDYRKKQEWLATHQPNSIKIGDKWYNIQGFEPLSTNILSVADTVGKYKNANAETENKDFTDMAAELSIQYARSLADYAYTENFVNFMGLFDKGATAESKVENYLAGIGSSLTTPAIVRSINQNYVDTAERDTRGDKSAVDRITGRAMAGWPGMSDKLPQKYDVYGRPVSRGEVAGPDMLSRVRTKEATSEDPVINELERLSSKLKGPLVGPPQEKVKGIGQLNAEQFQDYQRLSGQFIVETMREIMQSDDWQRNMSDAEKIALIKKTVKQMRQLAREELFGGGDEGSE